VINNTAVADNPALLLPAANGPIAQCHQQNISFVHVTCTIDFNNLVTVPNYGPTTLWIGFYIELPQTTVAMMNRNNVAYNLTTWHGVADLSTLTAEAVRTHILEPCLQDGLIVLRPADFNLGNANIDTTAIMETIHAKILKLRFKQICASIINSNQPHALLEHIWQTLIRPNGQPVTATVIEYYQRMMNAARPFATQQRYAIIVYDRFIQGLDKTLLLLFR
jgi:hypothetical protein